MILYLKNPKDFNKKLFEFINEFSKFTGYNVNMQKLLCLFTPEKKKPQKAKTYQKDKLKSRL